MYSRTRYIWFYQEDHSLQDFYKPLPTTSSVLVLSSLIGPQYFNLKEIVAFIDHYIYGKHHCARPSNGKARRQDEVIRKCNELDPKRRVHPKQLETKKTPISCYFVLLQLYPIQYSRIVSSLCYSPTLQVFVYTVVSVFILQLRLITEHGGLRQLHKFES